MKNRQPRDITCKKIAWIIRDINKLKTIKEHYSEVFTIEDRAWDIVIYPQGQDGKSLAIYVGVADAASLPKGWSVYAECILVVVNQVSSEKSEKGVVKQKFRAGAYEWGFKSFMPLSTLYNPINGYILNDKCIIEVEFLVVRSEGIEPISYPVYPSLSKKSEEVPASSNGELVDFKDLGQIEKPFIPLLEEVCLWHPSLIEYQKKRTRRFTEWAFTALGRVLHFLKTTKWKDMNENACEHLQQLWEELETCRFDLTWMKNRVQSALLGVKAYSEKAEQVKTLKKNLIALETEKDKLRENLFTLETEMKKLREKLANTEENVESVKKDLVKAEEGFEEKDLDAEIGY